MATRDVPSQEHRQLLGVYRDRATATDVLDRIHHLPEPETGRVAAERDQVDSLRAEMRQELHDGVVAPQGALVLTKEATKGLAIIEPIAIAIGIVVAVPIAIVAGGSVGIGLRILIGVLIGAVGGATVGFVVGAGLGTKGPDEQDAAARGVTLRVW